MHLSAINGTIEAIRPGQRPAVVQVLPLTYAAYVEARVEAHQEIAAGELDAAAARRLGQVCRLIVLPERCY
jgi:hypothetical protein